MALTFAHEFRAACLNGGTTVFNSGFFKLRDSGASVLASLGFGSTAFNAASVASPSVAVSTAITAAVSPTPGVISLFTMENSSQVARISGTVGVGSGDISVGSATIPVGTTSVTCPGGVTLTLQLA